MKNRSYYAFGENCLKWELEFDELERLNGRCGSMTLRRSSNHICRCSALRSMQLKDFSYFWAGNYCLLCKLLRTGITNLLSLAPMTVCH